MIVIWHEFQDEFKKDWRELPNVITEIRLVFCAVPGLLLIINPYDFSVRLWAAAILVLVSVTDMLDGYLARKHNKVTELGKILDPIVDKVLTAFTLLALSLIDTMALILLMISIVRAASVGLRFIDRKSEGKTVEVVRSGKICTVQTIVTMTMLFLPQNGFWHYLTMASFILTVLLLLYSWAEYFYQYPIDKKS